MWSPNFVVAGAQKCGTTWLHQILCKDNAVYTSKEKELPFLADNNISVEAAKEKIRRHFPSLTTCPSGFVSPQYFCHPLAMRRLHQAYPFVQIVLCLRNPIERAVSHYRMCVQRSIEFRDIDSAMRDNLNFLEESRRLPIDLNNEPNLYVAWSEYGRLLQNMLLYFDRSSILILESSALWQNPRVEYRKISEFVGWEPELHEDLDVSVRPEIWRFPSKLYRIRSSIVVGKFWEMVPFHYRRNIKKVLGNEVPPPKNVNTELQPQTRLMLAENFKSDLFENGLGAFAESWDI